MLFEIQSSKWLIIGEICFLKNDQTTILYIQWQCKSFLPIALYWAYIEKVLCQAEEIFLLSGPVLFLLI
jgi:hypothetical protein